jgi:hypothetical protein
MAHSHVAKSASGGNHSVTFNVMPDECPQCHTKGTFHPLELYYNAYGHGDRKLEITYRCPNSNCYEVFIAYYEMVPNRSAYALRRTAPTQYVARPFSDTIKAISPDFPKIYNQAQKSETDGQDLICGPGYRKSLEFLIKDYLIGKATKIEDKEAIKKEQLGAAIASRIQDANIKGVAKRAAWLGNDETHYTRKWESKDLQDLKMLIDLTVHWMEAEALTAQLLKDMPDEEIKISKTTPHSK